jgi:hypothetical protein
VRPRFNRRLEDVNPRMQEGRLSSRRALLRPRQRPDREGRRILPRAEAAEAMIGEVREDEPALAEDLRVEAIELG